MRTSDNQNPHHDISLEIRLRSIEKALLGHADRVEALEARLGHGERERETQNISQRLDALETQLDATDRALHILINAWKESKPPRRRPLTVCEPPDFDDVTWQKQLTRLNHPVVCVSWPDAVNYALWLFRTTGYQLWCLPTEAEWEKAARWDAQRQVSRIYPWGDTFDKTRCNTYETYESGIDISTPVGSYPNGASPCGAQDMAGNVLEWTISLYKPYPYIQNDSREDVDFTAPRVMRGSS